MDVRPFTPADVPAAAALLDARGNAHPLAAPVDAVREIEALLDDGATGYAAPAGFLVGKVDGDEAWVQYAGHAARDVATYRHLYAAASRDWVRAGAARHAVVMPDGDRVAGDAFANLAFGREHVFALGSLLSQPSARVPDPRVEIARASIDDLDAMLPMMSIVARHLSDAPVWAPRPASYYENLRSYWGEDLADAKVTYHLARVDGRPVGFATWEPMPPRVAVPDGTWALGHMAVVPEARGTGVGAALTLAGLALGRERGFTTSWTDWRLTNMSAEPYWRTYGWTPYLVRMTRRLEPAVLG